MENTMNHAMDLDAKTLMEYALASLANGRPYCARLWLEDAIRDLKENEEKYRTL
jgi:hypothetical protein